MRYRQGLKWMHWLSAALILYFFLVEPDDLPADPGAALATHAGMGLLLGIVVALWTGMYLRKGLVGRAGPKLPGWAKRLHPLGHKALQWGLPVMVATGALAGLAAPFAIQAFGLLPITPGFGAKALHDMAEDLHEITFNILLVLIGFHALFHLWRHFGLKDNALRIMVPKPLHKYL